MKHSFLTTIATASLLLTGFGSLSGNASAEDMQQALIAAYNKNPLLLAERARVREIDENYVQAQAAGRLNISAAASVGRVATQADALLGPGTISSFSSWTTPHNGQLSLVQPLYQGGRVNGLKAQAKSGILAARQALRSSEQAVLLAAATAYLDVLRDEEAARIRRNNVRVLTRQKYAAGERFNVGEGTRTDIAQADSRLAAAEIGLFQADAQLAVSRAAYTRYMGVAPNALAQPTKFALPPTLMDAIARARNNNPNLIAARYSEEIAQAAIDVAKSAHRPTVSLNGTLQGARESSFSLPRSESASIVAQVRIPIFTGGFNRSKVRAASQAKTRSRFETREAEQSIDEAVTNLWAQLIASRNVLEASKKQVAAAEVAFEGVELEQQVGTRNTLDVLDAEQELLNAKLGVVQGERNVNAISYQLLVTMGGFDAYALQLPVQYYNPKDNFEAVTINPYEKFIPSVIKNTVSKASSDQKLKEK